MFMRRELSSLSSSTARFDPIIQEPEPRDLLADAEAFRSASTHHALLCWVVLPVYIVLQVMVPFSRPTCHNAYSDLAVLALVGLLAHYVYMERKGWTAMKGLLSRAELTIMKNLNIFKRRKWMFLFGLIMVLDLYTDLMFPFLAKSCNQGLTKNWQTAWKEVPVVGHFIVHWLEIFRFWGFSMCFILVHVFLEGGLGISRMMSTTLLVYEGENCGAPVMTSEMYFSIADSACTSLLPSVVMFSREMGRLKRFVFNKDADTLKAMKACEKKELGMGTQGSKTETALFNQEVMENAEKMELFQVLQGMVFNVMCGHAASLWLQASFFSLSYKWLGLESKIKLVLSMILSTIVALVRCWNFCTDAGVIVLLAALPTLLLVLWAAAKVCAALFICEDHIWNLTTGCVHL